MVSQTNEQALENLIESNLVNSHGFKTGHSKDFDKNYAIDMHYFWAFLETTQSLELEKLKRMGTDWQRKILDRFDRMVKKNGLLHLLKKGLAVDDAHLYLMYPAPLASMALLHGRGIM
jgi:type I restriction enzyme R subunit